MSDVCDSKLIEQASERIEDDTLLVLDLSDVTKKYAEKMENLGRVRADRGLLMAQGRAVALDLARSYPMLFNETVVTEEAGQERLVHLACGMRKVRLPERREELTLGGSRTSFASSSRVTVWRTCAY